MLSRSDLRNANDRLWRTLLVGAILGIALYVGSGLVLRFVPKCAVPAIDACGPSSDVLQDPQTFRAGENG